MKELLPFIMNGTDNNTVFFDCFGGGMNVISGIPSKNKVACDTNYYILDLWTKIRDNGLDSLELPKNSDELTFSLYEDIRQSYLNNDNSTPRTSNASSKIVKDKNINRFMLIMLGYLIMDGNQLVQEKFLMVMYLDRQKLIDDFCMNKCKLKRSECPKKQSKNQYNACEDVWLIEQS